MVRMKNTKAKTKALIDNEMAYFFGLDRGSYGEVLGDLSRTWVHSFRTSSIPLAEFWQPANLDTIRKLLAPHLPSFNPEVALDQADATHEAAVASFRENLRRWAAQLRLKNMKFLIVTVPVTNFADVRRRFDGQRGEIFYAMRDEEVYRFDINGTTVESVIAGDATKDE